MDHIQSKPVAWQYVLVWTPGPDHSSYQLWAVGRQGSRTLWDSWETAGEGQPRTMQRILDAIWQGSLDALERSTHRG